MSANDGGYRGVASGAKRAPSPPPVSGAMRGPGTDPPTAAPTPRPAVYALPEPPRRWPAKKTALLAGAAGTLVVALAAVVVLVTGPAGDDAAKAKGRPPGSGAAAGTADRAPGLPRTLDGRQQLAEADVPAVVSDITAVFARDFANVRARAYGERNDRDTVLVLTGDRGPVVPADFIRNFTPSTGAPEQPVTWTRPGTIRCWARDDAVACLWGDDTKMLYISTVRPVPYTVGQLERIYLGRAS